MVNAARGLRPTSSIASGSSDVPWIVGSGLMPARSSTVAYRSMTSTSAFTTLPLGRMPGARMMSGMCTSSWYTEWPWPMLPCSQNSSP